MTRAIEIGDALRLQREIAARRPRLVRMTQTVRDEVELDLEELVSRPGSATCRGRAR